MGAKTSEISVRLDRKEYAFVRGMADLVGAPLKTVIRNAVMREANRIWSRAQELQTQQAQQENTSEQSAETNTSAIVPREAISESAHRHMVADTPPANGAPGGT